MSQPRLGALTLQPSFAFVFISGRFVSEFSKHTNGNVPFVGSGTKNS
jgi:hypothetical protein